MEWLVFANPWPLKHTLVTDRAESLDSFSKTLDVESSLHWVSINSGQLETQASHELQSLIITTATVIIIIFIIILLLSYYYYFITCNPSGFHKLGI